MIYDKVNTSVILFIEVFRSFCILIVCLSFSITSIFAQEANIDSLKNELSNYALKDSNRVNLQLDIANAYFRIDLDSTRTFLTKAKELSIDLAYTAGKGNVFRLLARLENIQSNYTKSLDFLEESLANYKLISDKEGAARVYIGMGINHYHLSKYEEAMISYQQAAEIYQSLGNKQGIATCQINIGNVQDELGNYDEAISRYQHALELSNEIGDEEGIAYVNTNLGAVYQVQGNYPLALVCFYKALNFREKAADYIGLTYTLNSLGEVNFAMQKYDNALAFFERSLKYAVQTGDKNNIVNNNSNIGNIYFAKSDFENALKYFITSLDISKEINNLKQIATVQNKIGKVHLVLKNPLVARSYFTKAMQGSQETNNQQILANSYLGIAETYIYNKQYPKAISYIEQSQQITNDLALLPEQQKAAGFLHTIYKATNNPEKALENHEKYKLLSDSIFNKETIEKITALEYEYKYEKELSQAADREIKLTKEVQTTTLNLEKSQRNLLLGVIGFLLTALILGAIIFFLKLRNEKAKSENIITEQKLLRAQMTPHFIFNSLSVLQGMILNKEDRKTNAYLSKFSRLLRLTLENSRDKLVSLKQELLAINNYLELQNLEVTEAYQYSVLTADELDPAQFLIPPMLIQPFIENAIEHGFKGQKENRKIDVQLKYQQQELICTITDNGIGIANKKEKETPHKKSLATTITSERLKILSKDLKKKASITIKDRKQYNEQGTIVTMVIPHMKK